MVNANVINDDGSILATLRDVEVLGNEVREFGIMLYQRGGASIFILGGTRIVNL